MTSALRVLLLLFASSPTLFGQERVPGCPLQCTCVYQRSYYTPGTGLHDQIDIQCNRYAANFGASLEEVPDFSNLQSEGRELLISIEQMDFEVLPSSAFAGQRIGSLRLLNNPKLREIDPGVFYEAAARIFSLVIMNHDNLESMALGAVAQLDGLRELALQLRRPLRNEEVDEFSLLNLPNLHGLSLDGLQFQPLLHELSHLIELRQLSLIGIHLTEELVAAHGNPFNALRHLESLNLGSNAFTRIPGFLKMMDLIRVLSLENNRLGLLDADYAVENLPRNIVSVNLRNNIVLSLPCPLFRILSLQYIKLDTEILCLTCEDQKELIASLHSSCESSQAWYFDSFTAKPLVDQSTNFISETNIAGNDYEIIPPVETSPLDMYEETSEYDGSPVIDPLFPIVSTQETEENLPTDERINEILPEQSEHIPPLTIDSFEIDTEVERGTEAPAGVRDGDNQNQANVETLPIGDEEKPSIQPVTESESREEENYDYLAEQTTPPTELTEKNRPTTRGGVIYVTPENISANPNIQNSRTEYSYTSSQSTKPISKTDSNEEHSDKKVKTQEPIAFKIAGHETLKSIISSSNIDSYLEKIRGKEGSENGSVSGTETSSSLRNAKKPTPMVITPEPYAVSSSVRNHTNPPTWPKTPSTKSSIDQPENIDSMPSDTEKTEFKKDTLLKSAGTFPTAPPANQIFESTRTSTKTSSETTTTRPTTTTRKPTTTTTEKERLPDYYYYEYFEEHGDNVVEGSGESPY